MNRPGRKLFCHDSPSWINPDACDYFITICCKQRNVNQLCLPGIGEALLDSVRFYHSQWKWLPSLFLLMPDHIHMIVSFGREYRIEQIVTAWKRFAATKHKIVWQRGFFEHRLRGHENMEEKMEYILQNPVRAGLVEQPDAWPYLLVMQD